MVDGLTSIRRDFGDFFLLWPCCAAQAQFYKVYGYGTRHDGEVELSYWTTGVASSDHESDFFAEGVGREGLFAHAFEVAYGFSDRISVGAYVDFLDPRFESFRYARTRFVGRYRLFDKGEKPVDVALYFEYYLPDHDLLEDEKIEKKIIIEKDLGPVRIDRWRGGSGSCYVDYRIDGSLGR